MKVLIADDHWMIRSSLKHAIAELTHSYVTYDAGTYDDAIEILKENPDTDLVLLDLVMPGLAEFEGVRRLRKNYPDIPIAVISVHEDRDHVLNAIKEGVIAYIPKSAEGSELIRALKLVLDGNVYFPREILQGARLTHSAPKTADADGSGPSGALTAREEEVQGLVQKGFTNAKIAETLGLSANTVRVHIRNIGLKLQLKGQPRPDPSSPPQQRN